MSRRDTLAAQLAQLHGTPQTYDPDSTDNLDAHSRFASKPTRQADSAIREAEMEHYLNVGPSRLRNQIGRSVAQTLLGEKYGGQVRGRNKIFDDDEDSDEGADGGEVDERDDDEDSEGEDEDEGIDEESVDDEEDGEDDENEEEEDEDEDEDEDEAKDGEEDENDDGDEEEHMPRPSSKNLVNGRNSTLDDQSSKSVKSLDPVAALRDSRQKDIIKGRAIKRQRALFESLLTLRITYQKALTSSSKLPTDFPSGIPSSETEVFKQRGEALAGLAKLNERLFELREGIRLPGAELPKGLGKRKRVEDGNPGEITEYWLNSAEDSLALGQMNYTQMVPILTKWATKIQAATLQVGGKAAGSSKFLQSTKASQGIMEAVEVGLASRLRAAESSTLLETEEPHYRSLLRKIIDTRSATAQSGDTGYRQEKKKKRDAERGGSKGRKIRYTVHEKATSFVVPQPLPPVILSGATRGTAGEGGMWSDEQMDELFGSLLGGAGMRGGRSEGMVMASGVNGEGDDIADVEAVMEGSGQGLAGLGGLRVF